MSKQFKEYVLEKVFTSDKNKEGNPFVTKGGKPFKKVGILVQGNEQWYSAIAWDDRSAAGKLQTGDLAMLNLYKEGDFFNFDVASKFDLLEMRVEKLEALAAVATPDVPSQQTVGNTADTVNPEDIPW